MDSKTDDKSDFLGQLAHLEQQVSVLSSELQARSETIELLERSLNEKRLRISELEAALRIAQQSMLDMAWDNIRHCPQQIWAGIGRNLTGPQFARLREFLELIRSSWVSARQFTETYIISPGRHLAEVIMRNIEAMRDDSASYYQNILNVIVSMYRMGLKQINVFFAQSIEEAQTMIDQKVLWPVRNAYEDVHETLRTMPSEAGFILQNNIVRPLRQYAGGLSIKYSKVHIEVQSLVADVRRMLQPWLSRWYNIVTGKIKSFNDAHSFGTSDPDQSMTGTYA